MQVNAKNLGAGILFIAIGGWFALEALFRLRIGTPGNMGAGFFPIVLGTILAALGLAIAATGLRSAPEDMGRIPWRGLILVLASILFFAITVRGLGFLPALFGSSLLVALASGKMSWWGAGILAAGIAAFGTAAFVYGLRLPYPVIGSWISG